MAGIIKWRLGTSIRLVLSFQLALGDCDAFHNDCAASRQMHQLGLFIAKEEKKTAFTASPRPVVSFGSVDGICLSHCIGFKCRRHLLSCSLDENQAACLILIIAPSDWSGQPLDECMESATVGVGKFHLPKRNLVLCSRRLLVSRLSSCRVARNLSSTKKFALGSAPWQKGREGISAPGDRTCSCCLFQVVVSNMFALLKSLWSWPRIQGARQYLATPF